MCDKLKLQLLENHNFIIRDRRNEWLRRRMSSIIQYSKVTTERIEIIIILIGGRIDKKRKNKVTIG